MKKTLLSLAAAIFVLPTAAQADQLVSWRCNLGGQPAQLTARIHPRTGVDYTPGPNRGTFRSFAGGISYAGQLVSRTARYSFTGEDGYADFVDQIRGERFRVRFIAQGRMLALIANPEGPGPTQYMCQQIG